MEELIEKVSNLKEELDKRQEIMDIKELNLKIRKEEKLLELIRKYQISQDENIKNVILSNSLFREYKKKETDLNILILEINQSLKSINNKDKCGL